MMSLSQNLFWGFLSPFFFSFHSFVTSYGFKRKFSRIDISNWSAKYFSFVSFLFSSPENPRRFAVEENGRKRSIENATKPANNSDSIDTILAKAEEKKNKVINNLTIT